MNVYDFFIQVRESLSMTSCTGVITKCLPMSDKKIVGFNVAKPKVISGKGKK
jgi:hypothetical protein